MPISQEDPFLDVQNERIELVEMFESDRHKLSSKPLGIL
jgi:hypothetical protein